MPKGQTGTVAHFALERLKQHGVDRIYGYPGDGINGFLGALHESDIEFVQTRHEEIAAVAATAHAKFTDGVGLASLEPPARRRATAWLAVTSGLFGLLRPSDRIPAYRLSGDVTLPGVGAVSTYGGAGLDTSVRNAAGRGLVVDLRSGTYAPFWRPAQDVAPRVVTVRVLHEVGGVR